jgi:prepilin-type N-terminal cleavage/methylation domain-containing protein
MKNKITTKVKFLQKDQAGKAGFSLLEVVIGIALVGIALLGLAQLFTYSVMNNARSDRMTSSTYLAQEQIDGLRNLTFTELNTLTAGTIDEQIDTNNDGTYDFRRLTQVQQNGVNWSVRVLVFASDQFGVASSELVKYPTKYKVKTDVNTIISR